MGFEGLQFVDAANLTWEMPSVLLFQSGSRITSTWDVALCMSHCSGLNNFPSESIQASNLCRKKGFSESRSWMFEQKIQTFSYNNVYLQF